MLDLPQLAQVIAELHTTHLLRVETLPYYDAASDDADYTRYLAGEPAPTAAAKEPWLARLRADTAAGRRWSRLRVVQLPLTDYLRYECEWGYTFNVAAGEDVRILEVDLLHRYMTYGDFFVIDNHHVILSRYDGTGRFVGAELCDNDGPDAGLCRTLANTAWRSAQPFAQWWAAHPQYHRDPQEA